VDESPQKGDRWEKTGNGLSFVQVAQTTISIDAALVERLYRTAKAKRWRLSHGAFLTALEASAAKAFPQGDPGSDELSRYLGSLHLGDLALACACALGDPHAWDHFVLQMRPGLYRAADALDPSGGARELADSIYGDMYGIDSRGEARTSLLRYYHGRSSLGTWLRAVLAQRHVDRMRVTRRVEPLPEELAATPFETVDAECPKYVEFLRTALEHALAHLEPRDRLRMGLYYAQQLTLAETGRLLKEHEATTSRQLARTRKTVRDAVEKKLRDGGLSDAEIVRCFECASKDAGTMNLEMMFGPRKEFAEDRSI
jgi:RNA polymerase sigma factor (sigma-70 family)